MACVGVIQVDADARLDRPCRVLMVVKGGQCRAPLAAAVLQPEVEEVLSRWLLRDDLPRVPAGTGPDR